METHKVIYLTQNDADSLGDPILWCEDRITDQDTKYIRADLVQRLKGYAVHKLDCGMIAYQYDSKGDRSYQCTCGLTEVLKELG